MHATAILTKQADWKDSRSFDVSDTFKHYSDDRFGEALDAVIKATGGALKESPISTGIAGGIGGIGAWAAKNPFLEKGHELIQKLPDASDVFDIKTLRQQLREIKGAQGAKAARKHLFKALSNIPGAVTKWTANTKPVQNIGALLRHGTNAPNARLLRAAGKSKATELSALANAVVNSKGRGRVGASVTAVTALLGALAAMSAKGKLQGY